jgi:hypothetical protein
VVAACAVLALAGLLAAQTPGDEPAKPAPAETRSAPEKDAAKAPAPAAEPGQGAAAEVAKPAQGEKKPAKPDGETKQPPKGDKGAATPGKETAKPADAAARTQAEPVERQPYKIIAHIGIDPETRIDSHKREALLDAWETLVERFVGPPWDLTIASDGDDLLATTPLDTLDRTVYVNAAAGYDKVWAIRVLRSGSGYELAARELDADTGRLGPIHRRAVAYLPDTARQLLMLSLEVFSPSAVVGERFGKDVKLTIKGGALEAASPIGRVVAPGSIFQPLRVVRLKDGKRVLDIHFTYLRVEALDGAVARCSMTSLFSDPMTKRMVQANSFVALGVKAGRNPTKFRFVTRADKAPAAGYLLTARILPEEISHEIGTTDRDGRVVVPAGFANGLIVVRLLAGGLEPMVEIPVMPGESTMERIIPFDPKPHAVSLEIQLAALRDTVIDLVAVRARLEARLKARYEAEQWKDMEDIMAEFYKLPAKSTFVDQLAKMKEQAIEQQQKLKTPILTKTAQAQLGEVQALVDRYFDDEMFGGYAEGIKQHKAQLAADEKTAAQKKEARAKALAKAAAARPAPRPAAAPGQGAGAGAAAGPGRGPQPVAPGAAGPMTKPAAPATRPATPKTPAPGVPF